MFPAHMLLAVLIIAATLGAKPSPSAQSTTDPAACRQFFHDACSEAMGTWLPRELYVNYQWLDRHGRHIDRLDHFVYHMPRSTSPGLYANGGPDDGTYFVYGDASPPRGRAVYDYAHHIAFYEQGCCSWHDAVAASNASVPPKHVIGRNLRSLRTFRGVHLGMTRAEVMHIYGRTPALPLNAHRDSTLLAYNAPMELPGVYPACGQWQSLVFRADRLVWIQISDAC